MFGEKWNADWLSELPSVIKQYNNKTHHTIKLIPIHASMKKNENEVNSNLRDNREKQATKFKLGHLVRTADLKKVFSGGDKTSCSDILFTITEVIHVIICYSCYKIPSYRINILPEKNNEVLFSSTKLTITKQSSYYRNKFNSIKSSVINGKNRRWDCSKVCVEITMYRRNVLPFE